jgi:hypothetical protein
MGKELTLPAAVRCEVPGKELSSEVVYDVRK